MPNIGNTSRLAFIVSLDNSNFLRNSEILENRLGRFGVAASRFGQGLTRSLSLITGLLEGFAVATAATFDEIASQLEAVSGGRGFEALIQNARQLGRSTKFTAVEVLTLTRELKKLGLSNELAVSAVEKTIDIVTIFGGELNTTGDAIAGLTRQFEDLTFSRAADVLSVAFRKTALGTDNFREAFKNVGTVADATGLSFEKSVAVLGGLANAAQRAGIGGTRFKSVLTNLAKSGYDASEGLLAIQAGGNDFTELLDIFGLRGVLAATTIQNLGQEIEELTLLFDDVDGATSAFADTMRDKLFFQVARSKAAIQDIGISLGYSLKPVIEKVADLLEFLADKFAAMNAEEAQALAGNALFVIAIGPLIFAMGQLAIAVTALLTPIGLLTAGLFLVAAAAVRTYTKNLLLESSFEKSKQVLKEYRDELKEVQGDLKAFSTGELEGKLAKLKGQFAPGDDRLLIEQQLLDDFYSRSIPTQFLADIAAVDGFLQPFYNFFASIVGVSSDQQDRLAEQMNRSADRRRKYLEEITKIEKELEDRETERAAIAAERLRIQKELGLIGEGALEANEDLFAQTIDKLKGAVSEFAVSAEEAKRAIGDLNQLDLASFEQAMIGNFPQLLDEFGGLATVSNALGVSAEAARAVEQQFRGAAEAFLKLGNQKIADFFIELANSYERTAKAFEQSDLVQELKNTGEEAANLNQSLQDLGRQGLSDTLKSRLSTLTTELKSLIEIEDPTSATKDRIREVNDEIDDLNTTIEATDIGKKLGDILFAKPGQDFDSDLFSPFADPDTASKSSDNIRRITKEISDLRENLALAKTAGVDPFFIAIGERGLMRKFEELYNLFQEFEINKFNDGLAEVESRLKALGALEAEGLVSGFDEAEERVKLLTEQIEKATILTDAGVVIDPDKVAELKERLKEATQELRNFYLAGLLLRAVQGFANQIADAFRQAKEEGRRFGEVLKESLQRTFRELIAKLIVLTSLFLLLSVLSGGTGAVAGVARTAISGGFGSFIGEGLIGGGPGIRNLGITGGGGGAGSAPSLRVEGFLSGNNVVIANQRGTRAIDRTFG